MVATISEVAERFERFVRSFGEPSWDISVVRAPIDFVSQSLARVTGRPLHSRVPKVDPITSEPLIDGAVLAEVATSPWCWIFWSLGRSSSASDEIELSEELSCEVVHFEGDATSCGYSFTHHGPGDDVTLYKTEEDVHELDDIGRVTIVRQYADVLAQLEIPPIEVYPTKRGVVVASDHREIIPAWRTDIVPVDNPYDVGRCDVLEPL